MIDLVLSEAPLDVDEALALLRRTLRRNAGHFAFVVVVVDERTRGEVMRRLREWSGVDGVPTLTEFPTGADGAGKLDLLLRGGLPRHEGIVVPDGDTLVVVDEGRLAAGLNLARDQLREWVAGPFVVLLSSPAVAALARAVPDLYDVRHMVELRAVRGDLREAARVASLPDLEHEFERLQSRVQDRAPRELIESLLAVSRAAHHMAYTDARVDKKSALALASQASTYAEQIAHEHSLSGLELDAQCEQIVLGAHEDTPDAHRRALEQIWIQYEVQGRTIDAAYTRGLWAKYLAFEGEPAGLDEAIRILRDEVVPVFVKYQNLPRTKDAVWHVADSLAKQGRCRDGARVLREVGVAAFQSHRDYESVLRCLGAAASMFYWGGLLDEAIQLSVEEVLPIMRSYDYPELTAFAEHTLACAYYERAGPRDLDVALLHAEAAESEARRAGLRDVELKARALANKVERHRPRPPEGLPNRAARRAARRQRAR